MKSFYQFYQQMLKEGTPPVAGQPATPVPPPPVAGQPTPPVKPGAPTPGAGTPGAPTPGQGTDQPVPPPDQNLTQGLTMLTQSTDPNVKPLIDDFMNKLKGAGVNVGGTPTSPPVATGGAKPGVGTPPPGGAKPGVGTPPPPAPPKPPGMA